MTMCGIPPSATEVIFPISVMVPPPIETRPSTPAAFLADTAIISSDACSSG